MIGQSERLVAISRIMNELEAIREMYGGTKETLRVTGSYPFGIELGECDWLEELHRLLYAVQENPGALRL